MILMRFATHKNSCEYFSNFISHTHKNSWFCAASVRFCTHKNSCEHLSISKMLSTLAKKSVSILVEKSSYPRIRTLAEKTHIIHAVNSLLKSYPRIRTLAEARIRTLAVFAEKIAITRTVARFFRVFFVSPCI